MVPVSMASTSFSSTAMTNDNEIKYQRPRRVNVRSKDGKKPSQYPIMNLEGSRTKKTAWHDAYTQAMGVFEKIAQVASRTRETEDFKNLVSRIVYKLAEDFPEDVKAQGGAANMIRMYTEDAARPEDAVNRAAGLGQLMMDFGNAYDAPAFTGLGARIMTGSTQALDELATAKSQGEEALARERNLNTWDVILNTVGEGISEYGRHLGGGRRLLAEVGGQLIGAAPEIYETQKILMDPSGKAIPRQRPVEKSLLDALNTNVDFIEERDRVRRLESNPETAPEALQLAEGHLSRVQQQMEERFSKPELQQVYKGGTSTSDIVNDSLWALQHSMEVGPGMGRFGNVLGGAFMGLERGAEIYGRHQAKTLQEVAESTFNYGAADPNLEGKIATQTIPGIVEAGEPITDDVALKAISSGVKNITATTPESWQAMEGLSRGMFGDPNKPIGRMVAEGVGAGASGVGAAYLFDQLNKARPTPTAPGAITKALTRSGTAMPALARVAGTIDYLKSIGQGTRAANLARFLRGTSTAKWLGGAFRRLPFVAQGLGAWEGASSVYDTAFNRQQQVDEQTRKLHEFYARRYGMDLGEQAKDVGWTLAKGNLLFDVGDLRTAMIAQALEGKGTQASMYGVGPEEEGGAGGTLRQNVVRRLRFADEFENSYGPALADLQRVLPDMPSYRLQPAATELAAKRAQAKVFPRLAEQEHEISPLERHLRYTWEFSKGMDPGTKERAANVLRSVGPDAFMATFFHWDPRTKNYAPTKSAWQSLERGVASDPTLQLHTGEKVRYTDPWGERLRAAEHQQVREQQRAAHKQRQMGMQTGLQERLQQLRQQHEAEMAKLDVRQQQFLQRQQEASERRLQIGDVGRALRRRITMGPQRAPTQAPEAVVDQPVPPFQNKPQTDVSPAVAGTVENLKQRGVFGG